MEKTEMAITIATGILGAFLNTSTPQAKPQNTKGGYVHVQENMYVLTSAHSTANVKEASIKYVEDNTQFISTEFIDCVNKRHKIIKMQYFVDGRLNRSEVVDFPQWESNNKVDNIVLNHVCY